MSVVASGHGGDHSGVEDRLHDLTVGGVASRAEVTKGAAEDVRAMRQGELHGFKELFVRAVAFVVHHLDCHELGVRGDTRHRTSDALSRDDTRTVRAMAVVIHRVVVVVDCVIAVMGTLRTAVPHAGGDVEVVVVDA